jgi:hypothetical protein
LKHALEIEADKISASAREKIDKAGGTITLRDERPEQPLAAGADVDLTVKEAAAETATKATTKKRSTSVSRSTSKLRTKKTSRKS